MRGMRLGSIPGRRADINGEKNMKLNLEDLKDARADIRIKIESDNLTRIDVEGNGNGIILSIISLIKSYAGSAGVNAQLLALDIANLMGDVGTIICESKEQADVIAQIIKNRKNGEEK